MVLTRTRIVDVTTRPIDAWNVYPLLLQKDSSLDEKTKKRNPCS